MSVQQRWEDTEKGKPKYEYVEGAGGMVAVPVPPKQYKQYRPIIHTRNNTPMYV
jgi:hypothetical protein